MKDLQSSERILKILASQKRLYILLYLQKNGSATVNEIAKAIGFKHQATSKHLRLLALTKMVKMKKRGLFVTYRLSLEQAPLVKQVLRSL
ncbi:MAG: metalloregulator ArsR/SmtB family transcription factor [Kiritimatiellales bacterium]|nr:metalloregulator ArsR/SmtB family transcription factor [Kiritimatiellales bacterium]